VDRDQRGRPAAAGPAIRSLGRVRLKHLRASLLQIVEDGQLELLGIVAPQACELRGQFQRLRDEALIFAIEEETNLTKRFKVVFLGQLHHSLCI
jgi:hypothetical protein